ncbi:hypothetical protein D9V32_15570 [Mycetocola tolaasinivorans]|uniref:Uncharacterized protein n=1 Tax=Mycetocola tolaasinivorans TaxID=76635 RepID=A0A3L6ZXU1_9MICO|nr:hypothetical protein [Mycetocola tolaasinivorans]RLP72311.1 hypothetical protein D9V32_15570 [Mycetocola tolaasinivorans]
MSDNKRADVKKLSEEAFPMDGTEPNTVFEARRRCAAALEKGIPEPLRPGLYRNGRGAEVTVLGPLTGIGGFRTIGVVFEAEQRTTLGYLIPLIVTAEGMADAGFLPVDSPEAAAA